MKTLNKSGQSKLMLTNLENSIFMKHLILVGSVISVMFIVVVTILIARHWTDYVPLAVTLPAVCLSMFAILTQRIRFIITSCFLLFPSVCVKLAGLIYLWFERANIFDKCHLQKTCTVDDWRIQMLNMTNAIVFLTPSLLIDIFDLLFSIYLIYLFYYSHKLVARK